MEALHSGKLFRDDLPVASAPPYENGLKLPLVDTEDRICQSRAILDEPKRQFSFTCSALSTGGQKAISYQLFISSFNNHS
jgi:hypothetical protein